MRSLFRRGSLIGVLAFFIALGAAQPAAAENCQRCVWIFYCFGGSCYYEAACEYVAGFCSACYQDCEQGYDWCRPRGGACLWAGMEEPNLSPARLKPSWLFGPERCAV